MLPPEQLRRWTVSVDDGGLADERCWPCDADVEPELFGPEVGTVVEFGGRVAQQECLSGDLRLGDCAVPDGAAQVPAVCGHGGDIAGRDDLCARELAMEHSPARV